MQIEVIDDASTQDDPEAVVREIGCGRVEFHRQQKNVGVTKNFNTCLARSRGHLVHILHGDDLVDPGFYAEIDRNALQSPEAAIFMTRSRYIDESGLAFGESPFVRCYAARSCNAYPLYYANPLRTPAIVVRRAFYEQHGVFCETLSHVADWEMWARAIRLGGAVMSPALLARYREFSGNDTSRLRRSAENLNDCLRLGKLLSSLSNSNPEFDLERFQQGIRSLAWTQFRRFVRLGDHEAAANNYRLYSELSQLVGTKTRMKEWIRSLASLGHAPAAVKGRLLKAYRRHSRTAA
jgi:glycosyltransferase involved in cell wall biosynthesis